MCALLPSWRVTIQINIKKECKKFCIKTFSCLIQFLKIYIIMESFFSLDYILQNPIHSAKHFLEVLCVLLLLFFFNERDRQITYTQVIWVILKFLISSAFSESANWISKICYPVGYKSFLKSGKQSEISRTSLLTSGP